MSGRLVVEPHRIVLDGVEFRRGAILKKDFFSTNLFLYGDGRTYVLKHSFFNFFLGRAFRWIAHWLSRRESSIYARLQGIDGIPYLFPVRGRDFFLHEYIEGWPLSQCQDVPDGFFDRLVDLVRKVHDRGVAYADLSKRSNVIVTPDGRPYLIDFQISPVRLPRTYFFRPLVDGLVGLIQREDLRHVVKHKKGLRPDEMTEAEWELYRAKSLPNRLHKIFLRTPWLALKRRVWPKGSDEKRKRFRE